MLDKKEKIIIEELEDLAIDSNICPLSANIREIWLQYLENNIILDNGQMVYLNYPKDVKDKIFDYFQRILIEFIENEKKLNECYEIKNIYALHYNNINNTSKYVKINFDIIVSMDRVNKYIWNISKLLVDDIESYEKYMCWQNKTTNIKSQIRDEWKLIYAIRNEIEHPENLNTTFFERIGENIVTPQIIYKSKKYDLLEMATKSLQCVSIFLKIIIGASFLYSKYLVAFTDETRTKLFLNQET